MGFANVIVWKLDAREMAARSAEARRKLKAQRMAPAPAAPQPAITGATVEYANERLLRVRRQLWALDSALGRLLHDGAKLPDNAAAIDRLCSAQARLAEQERVLSGRPLPGSFRPKDEKPARGAGHARPIGLDAAEEVL